METMQKNWQDYDQSLHSSTLRPVQSHLPQQETLFVQQPPTCLQLTQIFSAQPSAQLRAHIDRYIPKVWHCLQLTNQIPASITEDALRKRQRAQQWLISFKYSLPTEGRAYIAQVLKWMHGEETAGRDPLLSIGNPAR